MVTVVLTVSSIESEQKYYSIKDSIKMGPTNARLPQQRMSARRIRSPSKRSVALGKSSSGQSSVQVLMSAGDN
jgi:hypothetical protein